MPAKESDPSRLPPTMEIVRRSSWAWVLVLLVAGVLPSGCQCVSVDEGGVFACEPDGGCGAPELVCTRERRCVPRSTVEVDAAPPVFRLEVEPPSASGHTRDEWLEVQVRAESPDVEADSVRLEVFWEGNRSGGTFLPVRSFPCDEGYCGTVRVDLSEPRMEAFRGRFLLQVSGRDGAGNLGTGRGEVTVTREKWVLETGGEISAPPVLDSHGTVYLSLGDRVVGVRPEGTVLEGLGARRFTGGSRLLAMGPFSEGGPRVLYLVEQVEPGVQRLLALEPEEGRTVAACEVRGDFEPARSLALGTGQARDGSATDVAVALFTSGSPQSGALFMALRPADRACLSSRSGLGDPARLLATGARFFTLGSAGAEEVGVGPSALTVRGLEACPTRDALLLVGSRLISVAGSSLLSFDVQDGACSSIDVGGTAGLQQPTTGVRADAHERFFFGKRGRNGSTHLSRVRLGGSSVEVTDSPSEALSPGLVLGEGGLLYGTRSGQKLQVWTSGLERLWDWEQPLAVSQEPTLDCARDARGEPVAARTGVWYVPDGSRLRAIIVDSRGIDADAPWPRFRHDPRATGNAAASLEPFRCPAPRGDDGP